MHLAILHILDERPRDTAFQHTLDALNTATIETAKSLGWGTELIAGETAPIRTTLEAVTRADAVIVMGGEDVTPALYDGAHHYPGSGHHTPHADAAHVAAIHLAIAHQTPLLGICRGLQLVNVALGGTLIQDLGPDSPHPNTTAGLDGFRPTRVALTAASDLPLDVDDSTTVFCAHHQAIDQLGIDLTIAARSEDGCVEAVVHDFAPVTAVQWHPEHPQTAREQLTPLLRRLERQQQ